MTEERVPYVVAVHEPVDQRRDPIFRIFERPIAFHRSFVTLTGSITAALMLSQAVYWTPRADNPAGWIYKSADEWEEETGLSRREQETARKKLREFPWWQEELRKVNGAPTVHYRIDAAGFRQSLEMDFHKSANSRDFDKSAKSNATNPPIPIIRNTEITNRDYAESTRAPRAGKVDEKTENNTTTNRVATTADPYKTWESNVGKLKPAVAKDIDLLVMKYGAAIVVEAIEVAEKRNQKQKVTINFVAYHAKRLYEAEKLSEQRIHAITPERLSEKPAQRAFDADMLAMRQKLLEEMENENERTE